MYLEGSVLRKQQGRVLVKISRENRKLKFLFDLGRGLDGKSYLHFHVKVLNVIVPHNIDDIYTENIEFQTFDGT